MPTGRNTEVEATTSPISENEIFHRGFFKKAGVLKFMPST
jgi:hypothetical protein